jgi:hypothetical protein
MAASQAALAGVGLESSTMQRGVIMDSMSAEAEIARTELPTWEYGWVPPAEGTGIPEGLFVG